MIAAVNFLEPIVAGGAAHNPICGSVLLKSIVHCLLTPLPGVMVTAQPAMPGHLACLAPGMLAHVADQHWSLSLCHTTGVVTIMLHIEDFTRAAWKTLLQLG